MCDDQGNITLIEHVVFQSKDAVWMTEVDIANLEDKQYIRKSYQSMMEFTKERQLEADVAEEEGVLDKEKEMNELGFPKPRTLGAVEYLARNTECIAKSTVKGQETDSNLARQDIKYMNIDQSPALTKSSKNDIGETVIPPKKPPRTFQSDTKFPENKDQELVVIAPRSPIGEGRVIQSPPNTPSIMTAGSRVSTFTPRTSYGSVRGHSRSKSETLKAEELNVHNPKDNSEMSKMDRVKNKASTIKSEFKSNLMKNNTIAPGTSKKQLQPNKSQIMPRSLSKSPSSSKVINPSPTLSAYPLSKSKSISPSSKATFYSKTPAPLKPETRPTSLRKQPPATGRRNQSKNNDIRKEIDKTSLTQKPELKPPLSSEERKGKVLSFGSSSNENNSFLTDGRKSPNPVASQPYGRMLRELSFHNIMSGSRKQGEEGKSPTLLSPPAASTKRDSGGHNLKDFSSKNDSNKDLQGNNHRENVTSHSNLQTPFLKVSPSCDIPLSKHGNKSPLEIRKSTLYGHEEDGSLMLDKPLLINPSDADLRYKHTRPLSPASPNSNSGSISDLDESSCTDYYKSDISSSLKSDKQNDAGDESTDTLNRPTSPESLRISQISENLNELCKNTEKEGFLHRTFLMREGKKCRKNWTNSYVRYVVGQFESNISGFLYFSKSKDEDKKAEVFEFHDLVYLERTNDKKTSRQQVLGLRNGRDTEVLLQFDDKDIADAWFTALSKHDGMQLNIIQEKEDKKGKKGSEKVKRESSLDNLTPDNKGITDKLLNFIKKRPLRETLEKKGIYKESVFGSTLAELASQDKTLTPIFVLQCIKNIERNEENLRTDGLYRISGNAALIQKIRFEIAQRNYAALSREKDVHNLSGSLKLFFRELKEPLIPFANYDDFIQASEYDRRNSQQVEKLAKAVKKLPPENFETLKVLLRHLLRVTEYESDNRMSVSNLAIVFGPCLLWPKVTTNSDLMTDVMLHNRVIEGLLSDFNKIFQFKR